MSDLKEEGRIISPEDIKDIYTLKSMYDGDSVGCRLADGSVYRIHVSDIRDFIAFLSACDVSLVAHKKKVHYYLSVWEDPEPEV